jgi:tetratricopeptide (TPR) repeat protein
VSICENVAQKKVIYMNKFSTLARFVLTSCVVSASAMQSSHSAEESSALAQVRVVTDAGRWAEADALLSAYLGMHPDSAKALYTLGWVQMRENKPKESLTIYTRAAKEALPTAEDFHHIALDYVLLGDYPDADKWVTRAVESDGSDGEAWYSMGRIKYTENRFQEAIKSFERALALMPRSVKAENNLGLSYEGLNRLDDAVLAYRQAVAWQDGALHPSEQPYLNLGQLLMDRNALDEALPLLQRAEEIAPGDSKIHGALGKLYARRQEFPQAQKEFEQALLGEPDKMAWHFQLGQVYRKEGMADQARRELKRAAELAGTHSVEAGNPE